MSLILIYLENFLKLLYYSSLRLLVSIQFFSNTQSIYSDFVHDFSFLVVFCLTIKTLTFWSKWLHKSFSRPLSEYSF